MRAKTPNKRMKRRSLRIVPHGQKAVFKYDLDDLHFILVIIGMDRYLSTQKYGDCNTINT